MVVQGFARVRELKELVEDGNVKYIGLSEAILNTISRAHIVNPITFVQIEWSLWTHDIEDEIVPLCSFSFGLVQVFWHAFSIEETSSFASTEAKMVARGGVKVDAEEGDCG
ncbi:hypothetical protein RYX36_023440 [Vicia faba]